MANVFRHGLRHSTGHERIVQYVDVLLAVDVKWFFFKFPILCIFQEWRSIDKLKFRLVPFNNFSFFENVFFFFFCLQKLSLSWSTTHLWKCMPPFVAYHCFCRFQSRYAFHQAFFNGKGTFSFYDMVYDARFSLILISFPVFFRLRDNKKKKKRITDRAFLFLQSVGIRRGEK